MLKVLASTARWVRVAARRGLRIFACIRDQRRFEFVFPLAIAEGGDIFGADSGDGLQQELGEIAEGDGVFAGDASLGHEEKGLGESAVDAGCGSEVGAERFEFGSLQGGAITAALLLGGVMSAKRRAVAAALASIGKGELAARDILRRWKIRNLRFQRRWCGLLRA